MGLHTRKGEESWKIVLSFEISVNGFNRFIEMFQVFYSLVLLYYASLHNKGVKVFPALIGPLN